MKKFKKLTAALSALVMGATMMASTAMSASAKSFTPYGGGTADGGFYTIWENTDGDGDVDGDDDYTPAPTMYGITAFAESSSEENTETLSPGTYVTTLLRQTSCDDNTIYQSATEHFSASALLTVDDNSQYVTIGVEHWSLYDAFIPALQEYNSTGFSLLPKEVFNSNNHSLTNLQTYLDNNPDIASDNANSWYSLGEENNKYGKFSVEWIESTDFAYVTFEIADYTQFFAVQGWFNAPIDGESNNTTEAKGEKYNDLLCFSLDKDFVTPVDINENADIVTNSWHHIVRNTSLRYDQEKGKINFFTKNMTLETFGSSVYKELVDEAKILKNDNGSFSVQYHLTDVKKYTDFKIIDSINANYTNSTTWQNWDYWRIASFKDLPVEEGNFITVQYNSLKEAIFGKNIYCKTPKQKNRIVLMSLCLSPTGDFVKWYDGSSGIYIEADRFSYSPNYELVINMDQITDDYYTGISQTIVDKYNGINYKTPIWYTIAIKNADGEYENINDRVNIYVPLPDDFSESAYHIELIRDGAVYGESEKFFASRLADYLNGYIRIKSSFGAAQSISIMKNNPSDNIYDIVEDGIYSVDTFLVQDNKPGLLSMADAAFKRSDNGIETRQAFIVVKDGIKKMYFKLGTVARDNIDAAYVGDVFCNNIEVDNELYWDSIDYTDFAVDENGNLLKNAKYDAITEWGCIKGGILTLMNECYIPEYNVYELAIASPIMSEIGEKTYEEMQLDPDSLQVWLKFFNLEKCDDSVTLDKILNEYGYGYQPSALLRKIRQAELKLENSDSFSAQSADKLQNVYDQITETYGNTYDSLSAANLTSDSIEKMITDLDNAIKALDSITVAGYNAQLDKDITFDFYLSMNETNLENAEDGDLKATITKADGSTETVTVGADGKIEFNVAPKEIGRTLKVKIGSYEFAYSVQEYLEKLIWYAENPTEGVEVSEKDAAIAKSLLVYGGYAQDYFVKKDAEANAYVDTERAYANVDKTLPETAENAAAFEAPQLGENIKYYGAAVAFDYATDIRLYFTVNDAIENHSFAVNDAAVTPVAVDGGYYIAIENIYANQLGNPFKITVDGTDFRYGVYNYIAAALNATEVKSGALNELQALVKALYQYAELTKSEA